MKADNFDEKDEIQIDLLELLYKWKQKLWLIILMAVLAGAGAGAYSRYMIVPQYTSTAMIYVLSKETTLTSLADLQIGSQLTKDYKIMVTSRPVLEEVVDSLALNITYKDLRKKISIDNPSDTRILSLTVQDSDPVQAKTIVNRVASTASDYIGDIMEMVPPKIIEDGEVSSVQISPPVKKNAVIGALAGGLIICALLAVRVLMDDTVRTEEDVEHYLGVPVLAVVPNRKREPKKESRKSAKKKADKKKKEV